MALTAVGGCGQSKPGVEKITGFGKREKGKREEPHENVAMDSYSNNVIAKFPAKDNTFSYWEIN